MTDYFISAIIFPFSVLTAFAYRKIFLVIQRSSRNPHDPVSKRDLKKTKLLLQQIKQAKSCFIVVIRCFVVCLMLIIVALPFVLNLDRFNAEAIRVWGITLFVSNSSVNSALFFSGERTLGQKEARKVLKTLCLPNTVNV